LDIDLSIVLDTDHSAMKVRDMIKAIENDGWYLVRTRGSHLQYKHDVKTGIVTIAGHLGDDLAKGTCKSIEKQAGISRGRQKNV
jgi:predicted RNA binding protein YcfA (HicA-like mRNA interferase family)